MTIQDRTKRKQAIERDAVNAERQAKRVKAIRVKGHPMSSYNGDYKYVDTYEGFPYYKSDKQKYLFHPVPIGWATVKPGEKPLRCPECATDFDPEDYEGMDPIGPGTQACKNCVKCPEYSMVDSGGSMGCVCEPGYLGEVHFDSKSETYSGDCKRVPHDQWFLNRIFDPDSMERNAWLESQGGTIPSGPHVWYHRRGPEIKEYHITTESIV